MQCEVKCYVKAVVSKSQLFGHEMSGLAGLIRSLQSLAGLKSVSVSDWALSAGLDRISWLCAVSQMA